MRLVLVALLIIFSACTFAQSGQQTRTLAPSQKNSNDEDTSKVEALIAQAKVLSDVGNYAQALPIQLRLLDKLEKSLGPEHPDVAGALHNLAIIYLKLAQHDKALPVQLRAVAIREKVFGSEDTSNARSLGNLALIYSQLEQFEKALPLQLRVLAINERVLGSEHSDTVRALIHLASTYSQLAQFDKALPLQLRVLTINERVLGSDHTDTAMALTHLASTYSQLAQFDKALPLQLRVLATNEKVLGSDHVDTGRSLGNLGLTYLNLAQYDKALLFGLRTLETFEKALAPEHPDMASALNNLASTYVELAQYDKAVPIHLKVIAIREKVFGPEHPSTARSLSNLASTYTALAQHEKALTLDERVLSVIEKTLGPDHPDTATTLANLASTHAKLANYDKALPLELRVFAIREKVLGPEHPDTATALTNTASTYSGLSQYDEALPLQLRALAIREKVFGPEHPSTARSLNNLASTYTALAQHEKALPLHLRALGIQEKVLGPAHPDTARSEALLGRSMFREGNSDLAFSLLKSAVNSMQTQRELVSRIGATELKSYSESISFWYKFLSDKLIERGRLSEAHQVLDMLKQDEQFEFIRRASDADPRVSRIGYTRTELDLLRRYRVLADRLGKLGAEEREIAKQLKFGLTPEQKQRQQAITSDLKVAQAAFQVFLGEVREGLALQEKARRVELEEVSTQAMRASQSLIRDLGDEVVLLQYYITDKRVGMLLTTAGIQLARHTDISSEDLNQKISEFRRLIQNPKANPLPVARDLYQILVAPVAKDLEQVNAKTVMLSLDGALRYLPFGALHDGERYLVNRWNLPMYTSVTRNKLRDEVSPSWHAVGLGVTKAWPEFKPLAGVRTELGAIIKTEVGGIMPGEVYLDEAFTAERLKNVSQRRFPLMHVASHFRFSPGTEANSFLLLGDGERLTLGDIRIQNYRFDNVDLLTLSACDTGLGGGRDERGKEIEGFGVIAQQQGAKAVLATLWSVADESTAMLMAEMYRRRNSDSLTKIEALRQSQLLMTQRKKYAHPYYWAPFILMGNWK
jgi:CHAT domain-containing protein